MADQENFVRVTRLAKKRAAEAMVQQLQQPNKKRVVLTEIQDLCNVGINQIEDKVFVSEPLRPKCKHIIKRKLKISDDDPQMCTAYVSDIYDYLHQMEVSAFLFTLFYKFLNLYLFGCYLIELDLVSYG